MQFTSSTSREEILTALTEEARRTWGEERLDALKSTLEVGASAAWQVLQIPLTPLSEEPHQRPRLDRDAREE